MKIAVVIALVVLSAVVGCSKHITPSVDALITRTEGVLVTSEVGRKVDIAVLMPYLRRASWTDERISWKISTDVSLADGKKMRFEQLVRMFRIEGIDGTFIIREEDSAAYDETRRRILGR